MPVGDVCKMETKIYSPDSDLSLSNIHLILCADSDIIHVNALGTSIIILNSYKAATDLLDQRSSTYLLQQVCRLKYPFPTGRNFMETLPSSGKCQFYLSVLTTA